MGRYIGEMLMFDETCAIAASWAIETVPSMVPYAAESLVT